MEPPKNEITYHCKASLYPPGQTLAIVTGIGMTAMFITIYIHPVVAVIAMLGAMYATMLAMTGASAFTLDANGISREIFTSLKLGKNKAPQKESHRWEQLQWYKEGKDKGRFSAEYRFLTLHFKNGAEWMITDNNGARNAEFESFLQSFLQYVEEYNRLTAPAPLPGTSAGKADSLPAGKNSIRQRKTFYETIWAKLFTVILGFFIVAVIFLMATTGYISATNMFRLFVVIIPGFIYMWYRVFREKK